MEYLEMIVLFVSACERALMMGKTIAPHVKKLSPREKELLLAAQDGHFLLIDCGHMTLLHAGGRSWGDLDQPAIAAQYLDAFENLCNRGLVRYIAKNHFQLTGKGFLLREKLQSPSWPRRLINRLKRLFCGHSG